MTNIKLPKHVQEIIHKLKENGHEAYAVGGCVRDSVMGKTPKDWDITTSAEPEQVKKLFYRTIDTGLKHGTVTVLLDRVGYEVTTYRIDGIYENNRSPVSVAYTGELIEDLRRRDFTMNAMAYNEEDGIVDAFNGMTALQNKTIACVGNPNERFQEDALRMLRAVRFAAQLGFNIQEDTAAAITQNAHLIKNISGERIHMEMTKILISPYPETVEKLVTLGLMQYIIPEFTINVGLVQDNKHHIYPVDRHIYESLKHIEATETLRWTMFLHDVGKGYCKTIDAEGVGHFYGHPEKSVQIAMRVLNTLRFDNKTAHDILELIKFHDHRIHDTMKSVRRAVHLIGEALFPSYIQVQQADVQAQNPEFSGAYSRDLENIKALYQQLIALGQCTRIKDLAVDGKDLIAIGIGEGKAIGTMLTALLECVLESPEHNTKEWLLEKAAALKTSVE